MFIECLVDVVVWFLLYFIDVIVGDLWVGKMVLIVVYGNLLCVLVKYLD